MRISRIAILCALLASVAFSQTKVGVINSGAILSAHSGTAAAEAQLRKKMELWQKQAEQKQADLMKMQQDFQAQAMYLSAEQKQLKEQSFKKGMEDLQVFIQQKEKEGIKLRNDLLKPITDQVNLIIETIAKAEGYDVVLDEAGQVVYAKDNLNLTNKVLAKIKAQ